MPAPANERLGSGATGRYPFTMTSKAKALLDEVLKLSAEERAELAAHVLASLDGAEPADLSPAWRDEIERRARRVLAGEAQGAPWAEVRARIEARLQRG